MIRACQVSYSRVPYRGGYAMRASTMARVSAWVRTPDSCGFEGHGTDAECRSPATDGGGLWLLGVASHRG